MDIQFHYEAIRKDFIIFHIHKDKGNYYKSPLVDTIRQLGRCKAVVYQQGNSCYALFSNELRKNPLPLLKEKAEEIDSAVAVQPIAPETLPKNELAQLLSNALPVLLDDYATYSNVQGKLYYQIKNSKSAQKGPQFFSMLQLQFNKNLELTMKMQPFTLLRKGQNASNHPLYVFDPDTGALRRAMDSDPAALPRYENRALNPKRKSTLPFLCFDSLENYRACKVGILHRYRKDVAEALSSYMALSPLSICESKHYIPDLHQLPDTLAETRKRLTNVSFYLEDKVQNSDSACLFSLLQHELEHHSHVHALTDTPVPGSVVLRIIHNRDWYAFQNLPDPHESAHPGYVLQHVTVEDFQITGSRKDTDDAALRKVLLEIAIKLDIYHGAIHMYPWTKLNLSEPIHFVSAEDEPNTSLFHCFRLTIQPDGQMQFDHWQSDSPHRDSIQLELTHAFLNAYGKRDRLIDGLVYLENAPICKIQQTDRYTLPNMEQLEQALHATIGGTPLDVLPIKNLAQELCAAEPEKQQSTYQKILNSLEALGSQAPRKEIRRAINLRSSAGQKINLYYWEQTGTRIGNGIRQKRILKPTLAAHWTFAGTRRRNLSSSFSATKTSLCKLHFHTPVVSGS